MYEEEDDDLPMQYRRLTAHLQTGSADFNRRLSAYLTNHVAMRSALDQAITNSYAQQYPNAPQFAHNQQSMYPSPFMTQSMPQQQSPLTYGQPYPTPGTPSYRPTHQSRPASISHGTPHFSPTNMTAPSPIQGMGGHPQMEQRRTSGSSNKSASHSPHGAPATPQSATSRPTLHHSSSAQSLKQEGQTQQQQQPMRAPPPPSPQQSQQPFSNLVYSNMSPFTTSLPMESQMLLGGALDPNDPMTPMLMAGSENMPQPYNYNSTSSLHKPRAFSQSYDGMSATLAPSALDMSPRHQNYNQPSSTSLSSALGNLPAFYDTSLTDFSKNQLFPGSNSSGGSGTVTPGLDGGFDAFINPNWGENAT